MALTLLLGVTAACRPALEVATLEQGLRLAAEAARRQQGDAPAGTEQSDSRVVLALHSCEWDRAAKAAAPIVTLPQAPHQGGLPAEAHHPPRSVLVSETVTPSRLLATSGPHRNHPPLAPPGACAPPGPVDGRRIPESLR